MLFVHQLSVHPVHLDSMRLTCITCMGAASYLLGVYWVRVILLEVIILSLLCPFKINMIFKITIELAINHY
jgi:hypothetical protein